MVSVTEQSPLLSVVALMAKKQLLTASLVLCYFIQYITCFCNVTCTTDYESSLNCTCSGKLPSNPVLVEAECRDFEDQRMDFCKIKPSQNWCIMLPEDFSVICTAETICNTSVKSEGIDQIELSTNWKLHQFVKPQPPFNVTVTGSIDCYNITWKMKENIYLDNKLTYNIHIRAKNNYLKDQLTYHLKQDQKYFVLNSVKLRPRTEYVANVQASINDKSYYQGPWSEWSSSVEWRTTGENENSYWHWLVVIVICILSCLCYLFKKMLPKMLQFMSYTPNPENYFKPLYHTYGGDFKKWVGPIFVFSELEPFTKNRPVQMMTEKQMEVLGLSKLSVEEDCSSSTSGDPDTGHSAGHISIDTVMVSGEEGPDSGSSWEMYSNRHGRGSFSPYTGSSGGGIGNRVKGPIGSRADVEIGLSGHSEMQESIDLPEWQLQVQAHNYEPEQISLDSEDGYPPMGLDLDSVDTIDSGVFVESGCSSPVNSNYDTEEQKDSSISNGEHSFQSNYVKQWVTDNTVQGDTSNTEKESGGVSFSSSPH
ncbi:hypothetical protein UPYG_G00099690 [Umbra pygmaea]|uniref:Uncharacterized protein n=1 Tax=Umbra pygmaea TaxID=75934 RepID=A0ABD0XGB0_UMBPY